MTNPRDHELFTHTYVDPPTVVLPRVYPSSVAHPPSARRVSRHGGLLALGIAVAVGIVGLVAGLASAGGSGGSGSSSTGGTAVSTSAADDCSRAVLTAFEYGLTDGDIGDGAMQVIDAHGMESVENDAWQAALASGAQGEAFQYGAAAGLATATPAVEAACRNGYGDAPSQETGAPDLPTDECSTAVLDALDTDRQVATLGNAPGGNGLVRLYGTQSIQYRTYVSVVERFMVTSVEYGADRAMTEVAPTVESQCTA